MAISDLRAVRVGFDNVADELDVIDGFLNSQELASGTYTPTLSNTVNVSASVAYACQYMRVGSVVTVSGRIDIDPTSANIDTRITMTLPIASNFTSANLNELGGTAVTLNNTGGFSILSNTSDVAEFRGQLSGTANVALSFSFTYLIV